MIVVFAENKSNRLVYTLNVLFKQVLKVDFELVDLDVFKSSSSIKINYSSQTIDNCISIKPQGLLEEIKIENQKIEVEWVDALPYFYKTADKGVFKYDLFAAIFFMITRYEEYLPNKLDDHGRFNAENSIAFKHGFLNLPVANLWALGIQKEIEKQYPTFVFPKQKYQYLNTLDIDVAYAYKGKSLTRLISSTIKSLLTFDKDDLKNRFNYFIKNQKDPYDVYAEVDALQNKYKTQNIFFFLLGDYAQYDKNLSHKSKPLQELIKRSLNKNEVGIHPSYASNKDQNQIRIEIERLEKISNKSIIKSRQHFLKLSFPSTYENLIVSGIKEDYSMGFASQIGFRAGICSTYAFFNLLINEERDLLITPFQVMDGTLNEYLNLSPKEVVKEVENIINTVKNVNGTFVSLWHNSSLGECYVWKKWSVVYEDIIQLAQDKK